MAHHVLAITLDLPGGPVPTPNRSDRAASRGNQAVHRWSPGAPTHLVLLAHGIAEHARRYDHVADALVADGAVVVAPDHYGHGLSDGGRAEVDSIEVMVDDLAAVGREAVQEFPGLPVVLVGHSMGGLIATRFAQRRELDLAGLALSAAIVGGNPGVQAYFDGDPDGMMPLDPPLLSRDPAVGEAYVADPLVYSELLGLRHFQGLFDAVPLVAGGPRIEVPMLWLHGADDQLAPAEVSRQAIEPVRSEDFTEHVYPGARHEIFNETNKDEVIGDLAAFVRRVAGR